MSGRSRRHAARRGVVLERPRGRSALLGCLLAASGALGGCGAPPVEVQPVELVTRTERATTVAERRAALTLLARHRALVERTPALMEGAGELHAALGDWGEAAACYRQLGAQLTGPSRDAALRQAMSYLLAAERGGEVRRLADARGARSAEGPAWALAMWAMAAADESERRDARERVDDALVARPGDGWLLTAAAALALADDEAGRAWLLVEQALALGASEATGLALTLRAQALSAFDPEGAAVAYAAMAGRHDALSMRAQARFFLAHGRVYEARSQLELWLAAHPDDAASRALLAELERIERRMPAPSGEEEGRG